jgi:hypothetical protein
VSQPPKPRLWKKTFKRERSHEKDERVKCNKKKKLKKKFSVRKIASSTVQQVSHDVDTNCSNYEGQKKRSVKKKQANKPLRSNSWNKEKACQDASCRAKRIERQAGKTKNKQKKKKKQKEAGEENFFLSVTTHHRTARSSQPSTKILLGFREPKCQTNDYENFENTKSNTFLGSFVPEK